MGAFVVVRCANIGLQLTEGLWRESSAQCTASGSSDSECSDSRILRQLKPALAVVEKMDQEYKYTYQKLHKIYKKYQRRYKNIDSKQMCCMWSTKNPPDEIYETDQFSDIETVFDIDIGEDNALEIYDMNLDEATKKIIELKKYQYK